MNRKLIRIAVTSAACAMSIVLTQAGVRAQEDDLQRQVVSCRAEMGGASPISAKAKITACTTIIQSGRLTAAGKAEMLVHRSEANGSNGNVAAEMQDLADAIKADPTSSYAWAQSCSAQMWIKHNSKRAMSDCTKAIQLSPEDASGWTYRGDIYLNARDYAKAIADYDHAIQLNPQWMWPWDNRGEAYLRSGKIDRGIADFDQVIALAPDYAMGHIDRGIAEIRKGDATAALADFGSCLKINPKSADCLFGRGLAKLSRGDRPGASADMASAKALNPKVAEYFKTLGVHLPPVP